MNQRAENRRKATRDSWGYVAMPEQKSRLPFQRVFTQAEYDRISLGLIPREMENKWFIYLENQILYFHRSWTGFCIYQLHLESSGDTWVVTDTWVNRDNEQFGTETTDDYEMAVLSFLIDNLLLGKSNPFPLPDNLPANSPAGAYQHHITGTGYAEKPITPRDPRDSLLERLKKLFLRADR
jgi:hypothetical protein